MFASRQFAISKLDDQNYRTLGVNTKMFLAGGFAGLCQVNVTFIFDLLKVRKQFSLTKPKSYAEDFRYIYKTEGVRGYFKGYQGNLLRDCPGYAWFFMFYEWSKR